MGDYGASLSSSSSSSAAAELHLKTSKKIAQLTKVIFHLNTRNEDFQMEFAHLKQAHHAEQQHLTQDAATKLKSLTEQLQHHREQAAQADAQAASDKQQFLKDLTLFRQQAASQQSANQREFQRRVEMLEEQVEASRRAFVDRIQQLTLMAESQQKAQQSSSSATTIALQAAHRSEVEELRRKHAEEVEQVVMSSNARYNQMLGDQLKLQDALKNEVAAQQTKWEQTAARDQQTLQTTWSKEREEHQHRFDEMKQQFVTKMEHLLVDAETLRGQEAKLRAEKEDLTKAQADLQRQLKLLELQVAKAQHETHSVRKDSEANTQKMQLSLASSAEKIEQLTLELDALKKTLAARDAALKQAAKERDALQIELLQGSASLSERHVQHTQQLSERDLKLANLQAELAMQRQQTAANDALSLKKIHAFEANLALAQSEVAELQKKLASTELLHASLQKDKDKTHYELKLKLEEAEKTLAVLKAEHAKAMSELKAAHTQAIAALSSSHAQTVESLRREADQRVADAETKLTQHSSASIEKAVSELQQQHAQLLSQLKVAAEASEAKWAQEKTSLQTQLTQTQAELAQKTKEAADAQAKLTELAAKLKKNDEQLAQLVTEKDALVKTSHKTHKERDEAFQKQLKDSAAQHESALKRLTSEKDRLVADHKLTLTQLAHDHAQALAHIQSKWEADQQSRLASLNDELSGFYEKQLGELKDVLERERASAEEASQTAREQLERLDASRTMDYEAFRAEVVRLVGSAEQDRTAIDRRYHETLEAAVVAHAQELDRLLAKSNREKEELLAASTSQAEQKRAQLAAQHERALETLRQNHVEAMRALQEASQAQRNSEALALRTEMAHKLHELRCQKDQERAQRLNEAQVTHASEYGALLTAKEVLATSLVQTSGELEASRRACESVRHALAAKSQELQDRVAALEHLNREEVERLKLASKRDMDRLLEENLAETKQLSEQFEETRQLMCDKALALQRAVAAWEDKFARRESREEDVARIAMLEQLVAEKDALVKRTLDEMAYFKRELLNREEMYNKTFARAPNVGVLQVLKPHVLLQAQMNQMQTQIPTTPTPPAQRRTNTKPSHSPETQPNGELQRRGSERGTPGSMAARKALPPLGSNNNQVPGL